MYGAGCAGVIASDDPAHLYRVVGAVSHGSAYDGFFHHAFLSVAFRTEVPCAWYYHVVSGDLAVLRLYLVDESASGGD